MIQSYLKNTIFIALILFSFQEKIEFTVENLAQESFKCSKNTTYEFDIEGKFNGSPSSLTDSFELDLETSDKRKIKSTCTPYKILLTSQITCRIDTCLYPFDKMDIILPTKAPETSKFIFKDWEQIIGKQSGVSNKISNVDCSPKESSNTFIPSSVTVEDCLFTTSSFKIKGDWENKNKKVSIVGMNMILENENNSVAKCYYYDNRNPPEFECNFDYGKVKFKEQFFKGTLETYKIGAFDSGKSAKKCSDDFEDDIDRILKGSFYFLNNILIIFCFLLF